MATFFGQCAAGINIVGTDHSRYELDGRPKALTPNGARATKDAQITLSPFLREARPPGPQP